MTLAELKEYTANAPAFSSLDTTAQMLWLLVNALTLMVEATNHQTTSCIEVWNRQYNLQIREYAKREDAINLERMKADADANIASSHARGLDRLKEMLEAAATVPDATGYSKLFRDKTDEYDDRVNPSYPGVIHQCGCPAKHKEHFRCHNQVSKHDATCGPCLQCCIPPKI